MPKSNQQKLVFSIQPLFYYYHLRQCAYSIPFVLWMGKIGNYINIDNNKKQQASTLSNPLFLFL